MKLNEIKNSEIFSRNLARLYGFCEDRLTYQRERYQKALDRFFEIFKGADDAEIFSAPGRTEIGGNHTDHQRGCALAAAVDLDIIAVVSFNNGGVIRVYSEGYGFSEGMKSQRLLEKLVAEDREALEKAGIKPPYVLAPHSYSGFEAIYWANTYPKEVEAILSIDMGIPETAIQQSKEITELERLKMLDKQFKMLRTIAKGGLIAKLAKKKTEDASGLMSGNELTPEEKEIYRGLFYRNIANREFYEEARLMTENAMRAEKTGIPKCPICFYLSDMPTLSKKVNWRQNVLGYAEKCGGKVYLTDRGHMMYAYIPDDMASNFDSFLKANYIGVQ